MNADEQFDHLADAFAGSGVVVSTMFGKRAFTLGGKGIACLKDDDLAFKLGSGTACHTAALALAGAHLFDPSGKHRPFKDWVAVPVLHADLWPQYLSDALQAARSSRMP